MPGWDVNIHVYFSDLGTVAEYEYDFGDCWQHEVLLEGYIFKEKGKKYPCCLDGKRKCPPEDCGGVTGYYNLLEVINDPENEDYEDMMAWLGGEFDPNKFEPEKVHFDSPKKRLKKMLK